jgi:hypothetical protein
MPAAMRSSTTACEPAPDYDVFVGVFRRPETPADALSFLHVPSCTR